MFEKLRSRVSSVPRVAGRRPSPYNRPCLSRVWLCFLNVSYYLKFSYELGSSRFLADLLSQHPFALFSVPLGYTQSSKSDETNKVSYKGCI